VASSAPTNYVCNRQVEDPGRAAGPPSPTLLLGDEGDSRNNHWDNSG
jgi:hypothetical protein